METGSWAAAVEQQEGFRSSVGAVKPLDRMGVRSLPRKVPEPSDKEQSTRNSESDEDFEDDLAAQSLLNKLIRKSLVEPTHSVQVLQKNPSSPLYSVKTFEELRLKDLLLQGIYSMGFNSPSKIQEAALPMMLADPPQNLIAQSQSGTGKTAAFSLAMLSRADPSHRHVQCLCLCPTYELALQTGQVIEQMGKFCTDITVGYAVRGHRMRRGSRVRDQIVVGTPGTALDWCLRHRCVDPQRLRVFVLDEADVMIATQGYLDQSFRIHRMLPRDCQLLLFSATFEKPVLDFAERLVPEPNVIKLQREELTLDNIRQFYVVCDRREGKYLALSNIYTALTIAQAIIFCQTRRMAQWLSATLSRDGHRVALLNGEMDVEERAAVIQSFRDGKEKVLVTTNVCARGIDVEQVSLVVNFELPLTRERDPDYDTYLHRIGRTGRFGKQGLAVNMVDGEREQDTLHRIEEHFKRTIERLDCSDLDQIERIGY